MVFYPAKFERDVLTLDISGIVQTIAKCSHVVLSLVEGRVADESDHRHRRLLRSRSQRPRGCRAAEQRDELAAFHSITSSASKSRLSEILMPSFLAALRLTTNSNFVGRSTGKSAGWVPLRMRPA